MPAVRLLTTTCWPIWGIITLPNTVNKVFIRLSECCQTTRLKHQQSKSVKFYEITNERHSVRAVSRLSLKVLRCDSDFCDLKRSWNEACSWIFNGKNQFLQEYFYIKRCRYFSVLTIFVLALFSRISYRIGVGPWVRRLPDSITLSAHVHYADPYSGYPLKAIPAIKCKCPDSLEGFNFP